MGENYKAEKERNEKSSSHTLKKHGTNLDLENAIRIIDIETPNKGLS